MTDREFLRHTLATLAYRAGKTLRGAPESFPAFRVQSGANSPLGIVAHMADLMAWAGTMIAGEPKWDSAPPIDWEHERARFFVRLKALDDSLAADVPVSCELTRMFQGPIADALTHTGQLAMLRRLHGCPMKGESYNRADILIGRVGPDQTPPYPKFEFD